MIKLKLNEKNKLSSAILLILLILIISGVLCFMIFGLRYYNLVELPAFIENLFYGSDKTIKQPENDDSDIYNFLENAADTIQETETEADEIYIFDITLKNIREVIENIIFPDNIYIESKAEYYFQNEVTKTVETSLWKKGEKFRYLIKINAYNEMLYINDGQREYIHDYTANDNIIKDSDELFSFASIPNIQDINYYLNLLEDAKIINYAPVQTDDNESVARIKYEIPTLNQREDIYVSLDTGIVLKVRSEYGDNILYYQYTANVKEAYNNGAEISKTEISDNLFVISD